MAFVNWLTSICVRREIISPSEAEWFSYGVIRRLSTFFAIFILFPISCYFSTWDTSLSFYASFFLLRKRTNGYHAQSFIGCLFFSICSVYILFSLILSYVSRISALFISISSGIIIFLFAPFKHPNIKMTKAEHSVSAHKAKQNAILLVILTALTQNSSSSGVCIGISLGIGYTAFLLLLAYCFTNKGGSSKNEKETDE